MDFKALEYICAISEAKTISQAAKNLFISQPALSQYLTKIEKELGAPVFVRTGNVMTLTAAGEILAREGRALLMAREEMLGQVERLSKGNAETLRFGISPFYSKYYLPLLVPYYRTNYPNIQLSIVEQASTELEQLVLDGELDLCFIPAEPVREGLTYRPIYMEEIMIAVPPSHPANAHAIPSAGIPYLDVALLRNEPFVELVPSLKFSKMSQSIFKHFSITPHVVYKSTNWDTVCMLVAGGIGVGFLPKVLIHRHLHEPKFYRISGIDSTRTYAAVYTRGKRLSPSALNLISVFQKLLESAEI
mgnify:CR=1 FL=1